MIILPGALLNRDFQTNHRIHSLHRKMHSSAFTSTSVKRFYNSSSADKMPQDSKMFDSFASSENVLIGQQLEVLACLRFPNS